MIYTIFKNKKTNEEIIILEGNVDSNLICSISEWEKDDTEHKHFNDPNYKADWDDSQLRHYDVHGNLINRYKILHRLENGKNVYIK